MEALSSFSEATVYNVGIQVVFRFSTFFLNAVLLRHISKTMLGVVNVRLMLLYTTLSFCVKEPFRKACLTGEDGATKNWSKLINVVWLCPLISCLAGMVLIPIWVFLLESPDPTIVQHYIGAVFCFAGAVVLETLAEPFWIIVQCSHMVKFKAIAEASQIFSRNVLFLLTTMLFPKYSLLNFGLCMLISSTFFLLLHWYYFWRKFGDSKTHILSFHRFSDMLPSFSKGIDPQSLSLTASFGSLCFVKQLLTEGERFVMTFTGVLNFADQGIYDVVNNLGSLIARLVFAPLEESAYTFFSLTMARELPARKQNKEKFTIASETLSALLKLISIIGLIVLSFGPPYAYLVLKMYGGSMLADGEGPKILRWYCLYVVFLAANGITECFMFACMSDGEVMRYQKRLFGFCAVFLISAYFLTSTYGSVGFILANSLNMFTRICYSCKFIHSFYYDTGFNPLKNLLPSLFLAGILVVSAFVLFLSQALFCCDGFFNSAAHVSVGICLLLVALGNIYGQELELVDFVWSKIVKPRFDKSQ